MNNLILYTTEDGKSQIKLRSDLDTVWLTQLEMAELFDATKQNVSLHLKNIFDDLELIQDAVVKESLTTAEKDSVETKIARAMLRRTIEKYSTVDGLCEALAEHPERTLSFLSGVALEVVSNSFKSA